MKKVLIVEDDPMVAMINGEYLSKISGVELIGEVATKKEVFEFLEKREVDLILMDVFLMGESGLDILKEIRKRGYSTNVIMITSANCSDDVKSAFSFGCVDYLIKPFDFERFQEGIRKFLEREQVFNKEKINQLQLDSLNKKKDNENALPKGLNEKTLKRLIRYIDSFENNEFGIKEICNMSGLSNVTIKKYLDYLEIKGKVEMDVIHRSIGRPIYTYKRRG